MSSTRRASDTSVLHQQRWCSDTQFNDSISGLAAAKRIARVESKEHRELLWWVQWRSLEANGLQKLAGELLAEFPERIGSPAMRRLIKKPDQWLTASEVEQIESETRGECRLSDVGLSDLLERNQNFSRRSKKPIPCRAWEALDQCSAANSELPKYLMQLCLDPDEKLSPDNGRGGVWSFTGIADALCELQKRQMSHALDKPAQTEILSSIHEGLDFCMERRRWILIEGASGVGKSHALKAWCAAHAGAARYVEVPSSNDDRSFYAAIAEAFGVARGTSYNVQQIKLRVEEMLKESGLLLILDECQFLVPQYARPQGIPSRLQWLKSRFDSGTPIAMVGLPAFSKWRVLYAAKTMWNDEQLERRINRKIALPAEQPFEDFIAIAKTLYPRGSKEAWRALATYALASPAKRASAIVEALESASHLASKAGRETPLPGDVMSALEEVHIPSDHLSLSASASPVQRRCKAPARALAEAARPLNLEDDLPEPLAARVNPVALKV